jgi:bifunctional non-homologous end joining protein LigD
VKSFRTQEAVIGGWTEGKGEREGSLGALLLGLPADGTSLRYIGKVGTGFNDRARRELIEQLEPLAQGNSPFEGRLPAADAATAHFVEPRLVGEVAYGEWTRAGRLRHPVWRGLRPEKVPAEVEVESS